jgi:sterol-4alpha-carboxylate 3-dehydrogenase (decarboxylating)
MDSKLFSGPILVVGGCGFLGHHIVNEIYASVPGNPTVAVLDFNTERNRHGSVSYHKADITQRDQVMKVFEEVLPQLVFHTVSPSPFIVDHTILQSVNVDGTQNIIDCAKAIGTVRAFVYTSSSSIVHNQREPMVEATEDWPVLYYPDQPEQYSHTKALAEKIVLTANRENGVMLTASIRPSTLYGEGDGILTTTLTNQALTGRAKYRFGNDKYLYDTCYVENCTYAQLLVAQGLLRAAGSPPLPPTSKIEGEAFLVTNDEHIPFWELQRLVAKMAGYPVKDEDVTHIPVGLMKTVASVSSWAVWGASLGTRQPQITPWIVRLTTMERTLCIDKIKQRLGYKPKFSNAEGWVKALEWSLPHLKAEHGNKVG